MQWCQCVFYFIFGWYENIVRSMECMYKSCISLWWSDECFTTFSFTGNQVVGIHQGNRKKHNTYYGGRHFLCIPLKRILDASLIHAVISVLCQHDWTKLKWNVPTPDCLSIWPNPMAHSLYPVGLFTHLWIATNKLEGNLERKILFPTDITLLSLCIRIVGFSQM